MTPNMRGAVFMMIALGAYTVNDAAIKLVALELGLFQSVAIRGMIATAMIGSLCWFSGDFHKPLPKEDRPWVLMRTFAEIGGTITFLTALLVAPLGDVTAVLQIVPLAVTLAAALFLKEPLGWRRMLAILGGFLGVILIIGPSGNANPALLWVLVTVACIVVRDLTTRQISAQASGLKIAFWMAFGITGLGLTGSVFTGWQPMVPSQILGLSCAAAFILVGYLFSIEAMRAGDVGFVAPFRYSVMLWSFGLDFLIFDERPGLLTLLGCAIVVATGLYAWHRERLLHAQNPRS